VIDSCVGADPGPTTGLAFLDYDRGQLAGRTVLQVDAGSVVVVLKGLLHAYYRGTVQPVGKRVASVEKFVTGQSAGSRGSAADVTRQLVMELAETLQLFGYAVKIRPAADVKPWATNKRLAAGLGLKESQLTSSLVHGWDGARHCLYGAKEAGVTTDPLRRKTAPPPPDAGADDEVLRWLSGRRGV
jgi:hypothetical protein